MTIALLASILDATLHEWMEHACLPVLFIALVLGSLGLPLPEDVPLIGAGVLLKTNPELVSWATVMLVALTGIMIGDVILYKAGRRWGREAVGHRWIRSLITPERFERMVQRFQRWGIWFCFFGRFLMGVRAAMCITAGATRFPFWRFFFADFAGALLSTPFFVGLGYIFAQALPLLSEYVADAKDIVLAAIMLLLVAYLLYEHRQRKRIRLINEEYERTHGSEASASAMAGAPPEHVRQAPAEKGRSTPLAPARPRVQPGNP